MNFEGIIIGLATFFIIAVFHPIVVKAEYYFGVKVWPIFLLTAILTLGPSLFIDNIAIAAILGILGFTCLWSIKELFEQVERVEKGWSPRNPNRQ